MGSHRVGHDWSDLAAAVAVWAIEFRYYSFSKSFWNDGKQGTASENVLQEKYSKLLDWGRDGGRGEWGATKEPSMPFYGTCKAPDGRGVSVV